MAVGDIYEATLIGEHGGGEAFVAVWHYVMNTPGSGTATAPNLRAGWIESVVDLVIDNMSAFWTTLVAKVVNLDDPEDFDESALVDVGNLAGNGLPPVLAVGFRSPRQPPGYNRSHHQLPLGDQTWLSAGGELNATGQAALYDLQEALGSQIERAATGMQASPVTVKKTYTDHVLTAVEIRQVVQGQWETNLAFTAQKSRQDLLWSVLPEPV